MSGRLADLFLDSVEYQLGAVWLQAICHFFHHVYCLDLLEYRVRATEEKQNNSSFRSDSVIKMKIWILFLLVAHHANGQDYSQCGRTLLKETDEQVSCDQYDLIIFLHKNSERNQRKYLIHLFKIDFSLQTQFVAIKDIEK